MVNLIDRSFMFRKILHRVTFAFFVLDRHEYENHWTWVRVIEIGIPG